MAWYEQLDLDFGNIQDQFSDLIGEVCLFHIELSIYSCITKKFYVTVTL